MSKNTYTAENGFVITDDIVDKWAEEAEDNFPGATITEFAGRAQEDETQPLKPRTVRLSDTVWHLIEADAKRRKMTVSAWTRNAILNELSTEIAAQRQLYEGMQLGSMLPTFAVVQRQLRKIAM